jgi:hypothetical protein
MLIAIITSQVLMTSNAFIDKQCVQEFLPAIAQLQHEPEIPVRCQLVELLEAAVGARPTLTTLAAILTTLHSLLDDSALTVVKRAVGASAVAFR